MPRKKNQSVTNEPHAEETVKDQPVQEASQDQTMSESTETASQAELEALQNELVASQAKASEYLEGWQRAVADFSNYKKRIEREQTQAQQTATANAIRRSLELFDDLERALKNRPNTPEGAGWAEGIELIYRKFLSYLESEGVQRIEAEGQAFDPNLHEAISQEDHPDMESGMVIGVVQQGYRMGERVIRPARVRVSR